MRVLIECSQCLSRDVWRQSRQGQRWWWLLDLDRREFVALDRPVSFLRSLFEQLGLLPMHPGLHSARRPLRTEVDLPPGRYRLGCGPTQQGIRCEMTITPLRDDHRLAPRGAFALGV